MRRQLCQPSQVQDLTNTLLASIDSEGNVLDMTAVLETVSVLETIIITAEDLKVTRLGKFVNLIRRKLADVDKQLAKRLKNLVKQWQKLLQSKLPNGVMPPGGGESSSSGGEPVISDSGEKLVVSDIQKEESDKSTSSRMQSMCTLQVHTMDHNSVSATWSQNPSSNLPQTSLSSSSGIDDSAPSLPHLPANVHSSSSSSCSSGLPTSESESSQEVYSSGYHSRDPLSPSSPPSLPTATPPYSTVSSRPAHPAVSASPSKNRMKLMQRLSSVKRPSGQANISQQPQHNSSGPLTFNSVPPIDDVPASSAAVVAAPAEVYQSLSPSSIPITVMSEFDNNTQSSQSQQISSKSEFYAPDEPSLFPVTPDTDTSNILPLNGYNREGLEFLQKSRKRQRSYSPFSREQSATPGSAPKHKHHKHKQHTHHNNHQVHNDTIQCIVHIPLEQISLQQQEHHQQQPPPPPPPPPPLPLPPPPPRIEVVDAPSSDTKIKKSLLVSYPLATIRMPANGHVSHYQPPAPHLTSDPPPPPPPPVASEAQSVGKHWTEQSKNSGHITFISPHPSKGDGTKCPTVMTDTRVVTSEPYILPPNIRPGYEGCMGRDGQWYEWTDTIYSHGVEVTILPYIYVEELT